MDEGSATIGWAIATLVVLAVIVAGFVLYRNGALSRSDSGTNINVTVPSGSDTGGAAAPANGAAY